MTNKLTLAGGVSETAPDMKKLSNIQKIELYKSSTYRNSIIP